MDTRAGAGYAASWTTEGTSGETTVTEAEWLACTDMDTMLEYLRGKVSDRKLRLFACACCRRNWHLLGDKRSRESVEISERYAEGQVREVELSRAWAAASAEVDQSKFAEAAWRVAEDEPEKAAWSLGRAFPTSRANKDERACQASLFRDVMNNPFRPVALSPTVLAWNDAAVVRLAQAAYDERHLPTGTLDNGRLAVLADALEEAGCTDTDILGHLRGPGPHVRGCWPVDLCLGKS
jgi:hypothetical protein